MSKDRTKRQRAVATSARILSTTRLKRKLRLFSFVMRRKAQPFSTNHFLLSPSKLSFLLHALRRNDPSFGVGLDRPEFHMSIYSAYPHCLLALGWRI